MPSNIHFNETEHLIVSKAEQYCAQNEQCRSAVRDKLYAWGADRELTERVITHLVENDFINESRYCRIYCNSKLHLQKWGRIKIGYQLRAKRIDNKIIEETLQTIDEETYLETLNNLAATKAKSLTESDPKKKEAKLVNFLTSHGFEINEIQSAIKNLSL